MLLNKVCFVNFMYYIMNYIISAYSTEHRSAASVLGRTHALRVPPSCCCTVVVNSGCKIKTMPFFLCLSSTQTKPNSTIKIGFGFTPESKGLMGCKHQLKTNQTGNKTGINHHPLSWSLGYTQHTHFTQK